MTIQTLENPIEIDKDIIASLATGRSELSGLVQGKLPIFIIAEDTKRGKYLIGDKTGNQVFPVSKKIFLKIN